MNDFTIQRNMLQQTIKKKENEIIYGQEKVNLLKNGNILDIVFLVVMLYTSAIQNSLL